MDDKTLRLVTDLWLDRAGNCELVDWATEILADGNETKSVVLLAGLTEAELHEARQLFNLALQELGLEYTGESLLYMQRASKVAQEILDGTTPPNDGCALIAKICEVLDWPSELAIFHALAHEQHGHEHLGFTAENSIPAILDAARDLVEKENNDAG